jgi:hypothetical protein
MQRFSIFLITIIAISLLISCSETKTDVNANSLENLEEAKKYYTLFVEKYPDHELADDAQYELNTLGQDINDLPIFKDIESGEQASTEN